MMVVPAGAIVTGATRLDVCAPYNMSMVQGVIQQCPKQLSLLLAPLVFILG